MNDETPIACSLIAGEYQLRLSEIQEIGRDSAVSIEERPDGATLSFRNSKALVERLESIVRAESECCPFLTLELVTEHDRLVLDVTAPPDAIPIVRDLVRSFASAQVLA
jgi:hypothetical protein